MSASGVIADHGVHSIHPPYGDKWRDMKSLCIGVDNHDATKALMSFIACRQSARSPASLLGTGLCMAVDEAFIETCLLTQGPPLDFHLSREHIRGTRWS